MKKITCILVHPDPQALETLRRAAESAGLTVRGTAGNARALFALIWDEQPHLVFLHALTPGWDAEEARAAIGQMPLRRRPALIYLVPGRLPARQGQDCQPAISASADAETLKAAVEAALPLPVDKSLFRRAERLVTRMGLPDRPARKYVACAAAMAYNDSGCLSALSRAVLPALAERFGVKPRQAADAMRRLIDQAWTTGDIEAQYAFFGNTIDEKRGKPTLTAFLATAAELMRLDQDTGRRTTC